PTFRFPDPKQITVERISRRWARVKLPKLGWTRLRGTRPLGGQLRNATVLKDGWRWYISFCVEDGLMESAPNGKPPVGVDRGVTVAVATSSGWMRDREFVTPGEAVRLKRLQQQLARQRKGSNRRAATRAKLTKLNARIRARRTDFLAWTANRLTRDHGLVVVEDASAALDNYAKSKNGKRRGKRMGAPRVKSKRKARLSCRFTTGTIRVDTDGRHVTLPRLGTIRTHEPTVKLLARVQAGTARILSATVRHERGRWFVSFQAEVKRDLVKVT